MVPPVLQGLRVSGQTVYPLTGMDGASGKLLSHSSGVQGCVRWRVSTFGRTQHLNKPGTDRETRSDSRPGGQSES